MPEAIDVTDFDIKGGINSCFCSAIKWCSYFYHISYLEPCKFVDVCPGGLIINSIYFILVTRTNSNMGRYINFYTVATFGYTHYWNSQQVSGFLARFLGKIERY